MRGSHGLEEGPKQWATKFDAAKEGGRMRDGIGRVGWPSLAGS